MNEPPPLPPPNDEPLPLADAPVFPTLVEADADSYADERDPVGMIYGWAIAACVFLGVAIPLLVFSKEAQSFALSSLQTLPFLGLAILAYAGARPNGWRVLLALYWVGLVGLVGLAMLVLGVVAGIDLSTFLEAQKVDRKANPFKFAYPDFGIHMLRCGIVVAVGAVAGLVAFLPSVRRLAALAIPLDPRSFVQATALATVLSMSAAFLAPLIAFNEPPVLKLAPIVTAEMEKHTPKQREIEEAAQLRQTLYASVWLVPATVFAVGFPGTRSFREAAERLGFVWPTWWHVALAFVLVPALIGVGIVLDDGIKWLWQKNGWPRTNGKEFEALLKFAITPLGAAVIGLTAGVGEELAVRGVLQPRLGIVLSNVFFVALHATQYHFDGLLSVFVVGLVLGVLRKYTNTTTSALVHGLYDFVLVYMQWRETHPDQWW